MQTEHVDPSGIEPKDTVLLFLEALNAEDFTAARKYVHNDMSFVGVMGSREGGDVYIKDMSNMKFKYDIKKVFVDDNDVCIWYDINMGGPVISSCGWYTITDYTIKNIIVLFDPRPLLAAKDKP